MKHPGVQTGTNLLTLYFAPDRRTQLFHHWKLLKPCWVFEHYAQRRSLWTRWRVGGRFTKGRRDWTRRLFGGSIQCERTTVKPRDPGRGRLSIWLVHIQTDLAGTSVDWLLVVEIVRRSWMIKDISFSFGNHVCTKKSLFTYFHVWLQLSCKKKY